MSLPVFVIPTGVANTASVVAALRRAGATPQLAETPRDVERAERVVLPGVGAARVASGCRVGGVLWLHCQWFGQLGWGCCARSWVAPTPVPNSEGPIFQER